MEIAVAALVAFAVMLIFFSVWRLAPRRNDVGERLGNFGTPQEEAQAAIQDPGADTENRLAKRLGNTKMAGRFATLLSQADLPLTAGEFLLVVFGAALIGFLLGAWRVSLLVGVAIALVVGYLPIMWAQRARTKRRRLLANQLPDVLTLVTGALRAGYGLSQALDVVAREGPQPSAREYARVLRATELGIALPRALDDMARRIGSDDVDLLVTAINVQYEVGGNLSKILDNIGETIRERIRILREIRTLTSQQRLTGYILAFLPVGLAILITFMQPDYFDPFFEPGIVRFLPFVAGGMMLMAFVLIQKILDIEV
ncbi:MAG: type II secretion system F family protein [Caldilineaceae bacterium]